MYLKKDLMFAEKKNRDAAFAQLKKEGKVGLRRYRTTGQQLHPQYLEDRKDTPAGRDTGFDNTVYKTFFAVIYRVEWMEERS